MIETTDVLYNVALILLQECHVFMTYAIVAMSIRVTCTALHACLMQVCISHAVPGASGWSTVGCMLLA